MAELKTKPTQASVTAFMNSIEDRQKRSDARKVAKMMRKATGKRAKMWGPSIVGYGKYKTGKSCLYIKRLSDVDEGVLQKLIDGSVKRMRQVYETD